MPRPVRTGSAGAVKECGVDAVLGLSVTPSAVGFVLVDGPPGGGAAGFDDGFEVRTRGPATAAQASERAAAAVRRTEAMAADRGGRLQSIGVTWSDDADAEAALLLRTLSESGYANIVPVRLSEASDAVARGIAEMTGYPTTAVCVVEPGQLIAMVVHTARGAVQTAVNHSVVTEEDLIGWLSAVFARADWEPGALVLIGSAEDLDGLAPILQEALGVPVIAPAEAPLALARGAALACAQPDDPRFWTQGTAVESAPLRRHRITHLAPLVLLGAAVVTFVASVSAALALHFGPAPETSRTAAADAPVQVPAAYEAAPPR